MNCPNCGYEHSHVFDSRPRETYIFRRRRCLSCGCQWTTREMRVDEDTELVELAEKRLKSILGDIRGAQAQLSALINNLDGRLVG